MIIICKPIFLFWLTVVKGYLILQAIGTNSGCDCMIEEVNTKKWDLSTVETLFKMPFLKLIFKAQQIHRKHFSPNEIECCTLLSIKTGTCPEDCAYCSQSGHYQTGLKKEKLLPLDQVIEQARIAKANGSTRFCMGAAWRNPPEKQFQHVIEMIKAVKAMGLETCVTLGMLTEDQSLQLSEAGLDFYNHNLDTSPEHYEKIISTRTYADRLNTLTHVRNAGIKVCCGGILGIGETEADRISLLIQLANLAVPPESVPINALVPIIGTPLENCEKIDNFEFIKTIAAARIMMPTSVIRLSAGRKEMSEEMQCLCFMAGANSIWLGDRLLTTPNNEQNDDLQFLHKLGMTPIVLKQAV